MNNMNSGIFEFMYYLCIGKSKLHNKILPIMKNIKRWIFIMAMAIGISLNISAQTRNPDKPVIEEFSIDPMTINQIIDDLGYKLQFAIGKQHKLSKFQQNHHGFVVIPPTYYKHDGKSMGIIVTYNMIETFNAYDLRCPNCFYRYHKNCKMEVVTISGMLECPSCGAQADDLFSTGTGQLTAYFPGRNKGPMSLDGYVVDVKEDGDNVMLTIRSSSIVKTNKYYPSY